MLAMVRKRPELGEGAVVLLGCGVGALRGAVALPPVGHVPGW